MSTKLNEFDKTMMAAAFAEAGEHETARQMMESGGKAAARKPQKNKGSLAVKTLIFGALSLSMYYFLFSNVDWVTTEYTKGGWHAAYPVGTALAFSFIHGAFASNFLSLVGIEPKGGH